MGLLIDLQTGLDLDRQRACSQVNEDEDFANRIINSSSDGIFTYDRERRYTMWNPVMERISGVSRDKVLGRVSTEVFPFLARPEFTHLWNFALSGRVASLESAQFTVPETGHGGYAHALHSPLRNEKGDVVGGLAIVRDITEIQNAFNQINKLNSDLKNTLLFMADIGTLLNHSPNHRTSHTMSQVALVAAKQFSGWCTVRTYRSDGTVERFVGHENPEQMRVVDEIEVQYSPFDETWNALNERNPHAMSLNFESHWAAEIQPWMYRYRRRLSLEHESALNALGLKSYICVPVAVGEKFLAAVSFFSSVRNYTAIDLMVAEDFGQRLSGALWLSNPEVK